MMVAPSEFSPPVLQRTMLGRVNNEDDRNRSPSPSSPSSLYFWDISKSWTVETIALLLNKTIVVCDDGNGQRDDDDDDNKTNKKSSNCYRLSDGQARVKIIRLTKPDNPNVPRLVADVEFASKEERDKIVRSYQGLPIPETHGYNHFDFTTTKQHILEEQEEVIEDMDPSSDCRCCSGSTDTTISVFSPPLHLQILALPTKELEKRISKYGLTNRLNRPSFSPSSKKSTKLSSKVEENGRRNDEDYLPSKTTTTTTTVNRGKGKIKKVWKHALMAHIWTEFVIQNSYSPRRQHTVIQLGIPVHEETSDILLEYIRNIPPYETPSSSGGSSNCTTRHERTQEEEIPLPSRPILTWPLVTKQRKGVQSQHYLTVRQRHPPEHDEIWDLCRQLLVETLSLYIDDVDIDNGDNEGNDSSGSQIPNYNALAITKNFHGSPHIDAHDQTFQHVIALGDFDGGNLCCELDSYNEIDYINNSNNDKDNDNGKDTQELDDVNVNPPRTELQIEIKNRLGRMDGRNVHWVSGWEGKERYSIVYYSTNKEHYTDPVPQSIHVEWMRKMNESRLDCQARIRIKP